MRRLVIAVDFDDVLVNSTELLPSLYNKKYGTSLKFSDMYQSRYDAFGVQTQQEAIRQLQTVMLDPGYTELVPDEIVIQGVHELAKIHELHVITGRAGFLEPYTRKVLDDYFAGCFASLEHTNHFDDGSGEHIRRSKVDVCRQINADVMIDDLPHHLKEILDSGVSEVISFGDYPWSRQIELGNHVVHCRDWTEVVREVQRLAGG